MFIFNPDDFSYEKLEILGDKFEEEIKNLEEISKEGK